MLKMKVYERGESATLTTHGSLLEHAGKGGTIAPIRKNWNNPNVRIQLVATNKNGESIKVTCSKQVNDLLRAGKLTLQKVVNLPILENEEGTAFISMPASGALQQISADKFTKETVEAEVADEFVPEDLIF